MLERLFERGARLAERRAGETVLELGEAMRAELPADVDVEADAGGVVLSGPGLRRRFALEPVLRWLTATFR